MNTPINVTSTALMRNITAETYSSLTPLEQRHAQAALDSAGFEMASGKHRNAVWLEATPTLWLWAKALRELKP